MVLLYALLAATLALAQPPRSLQQGQLQQLSTRLAGLKKNLKEKDSEILLLQNALRKATAGWTGESEKFAACNEGRKALSRQLHHVRCLLVNAVEQAHVYLLSVK
jgi:hypothetical protein